MLRESPLPIPVPVVPSDTEMADFIDAIIVRLETHGWIKHSFGEPEGPNCVSGAALHAYERFHGPVDPVTTSYPRFFHTDLGRKLDRLADLIGDTTIPTWNDRRWRTKGQVIRKLRKLSESLR